MFQSLDNLDKTKVRLDLLTDIDILLIVEKELEDWSSNSSNKYPKAVNKYIKDWHKNKECLYLNYWDANNLYGGAMSQKLFLNELKIFLNLMKIS